MLEYRLKGLGNVLNGFDGDALEHLVQISGRGYVSHRQLEAFLEVRANVPRS